MHTVRMEWLQVFAIGAALLGVIGMQTMWVIHALERLERDVIRDPGERISRLEARLD